MLARNIKLSWAPFSKIQLNQIRDETGRSFIRELRNLPKSITTDVYVCSDARNQAIRQILGHIPYVNVLNTAGNVIYHPHQRPSVVIAHGNSIYKGCGAIDYARNRLEPDGNPEFPDIAALHSNSIKNAQAQLEKISPEWRGGVIFFNHAEGTVHMIEGENQASPACMALFDELKKCLENMYTSEELESMAEGQHPEIIFLNNIYTRLCAFRLFRINLQRDSYHGIINDSLKYAMVHSLQGQGSFKDTKVAVLAFRRDEPIPHELQDLLETQDYVREYVQRGGEIYVVTVGDMPSSKAIYGITPHAR